MTRPTALTLSLSLAASLLVTAAATAEPATTTPASRAGALQGPDQLAGLWRVDGVDARGERFTGAVTLLVTPRGLCYTRRVAGASADEVGDARLVAGRLYLCERPAAAGLALQLTGLEPNATEPRRAVYAAEAAGAHVLSGRFTGSPRTSGHETLRRADADNALELLVDAEAFPRIFAALRGARRSIYLQTFSWFDDATGFEVARILAAKRAEGLDVRCLVEAVPQKNGVGWKVGRYLKEQGVDLRLHHGLGSGILESLKGVGRKITGFFGRLIGRKAPPPRESRGVLNHDHRKLIVVDGAVGFTGGMNIADKYANARTWHDVHCRVEGSAARRMVDTFFDRWRASGGKGEPAAPLAPEQGGDYPVQVVVNVPGLNLDVTRRYVDEIGRAARSIHLENPYLLYDPVVNGLKGRARAGVDVVAIIPDNDRNDEAMVRDAFDWIQNDVVRSGVKLFKYRDRMAHGKVAAFDGRLATVGSTNLDTFAMERNAEINVFVPDARFCETLEQEVFRPDVLNSRRAGVVQLGFWQKLKSGALHAIRSFL